jgi:HEAT repeat protein
VLIRIDAAVGPRLGLALTDSSDVVRHAAALALVYSEEPDAVPQLLSALNGEDRAGVEAASFVLTELICLGAIEEADAFETVRKFCRNIDPATRRNATRAIVLFKDTKPVLEVLDTALEDSDPGVVEVARGVRDAMENAL